MSLSLTQIRELDREILLEMDDRTLTQACQTNQWLRNICSDDLFWRERLQRRYGDEYLEMKPPQESYHQMYVRLAQLKYTPEQGMLSAAQGHLDELWLLVEAGVELNPDLIIVAARNGQLDVIKWAFIFWKPQRPFLRTIMRQAARFNQLEVMKWLDRRHPGLIDMPIIVNAVKFGGPSTLDWLLQMGHVPNRQDMKAAISNNNIGVIDWLARHDVEPTYEDATIAAMRGKLRSLQHLYQQYDLLPLLNQDQINMIASYGYLDLLDWLEAYELGYPDARAVEMIERIIGKDGTGVTADYWPDRIANFYNILDWMAERGLY